MLGTGGRENALAWRLAGERGVEAVFVAPGNPGMRDVAQVRPDVRADEVTAVLALVAAESIELVVVGPEGPLVDGVADALRAEGVVVFGPDAGAARIEGSKAFCREVATVAGIPMAEGDVFDSVASALAYAQRLRPPVVVKADGLAGGKGVTVCHTLEEAEAALTDALVLSAFGTAGRRVVVERALVGREASVIALCDATTAVALPAARDHKRLGEGDSGPNTGGMGAYSPVAELDAELVADILERFHRPILAELARRGTAFRGALYAGLMLTEDGPRLLEFNARFGDPEAQALLPGVAVPLAPLLLAAAEDRLAAAATRLGVAESTLPAAAGHSVAIVLAAAGYPGRPRSGDVIEGVEDARNESALVFWGGVAARGDERLVTAGGRVMTLVARGPSLEEAAERAYRAAGRIDFAGRQMRRDIARSAVGVGVR